MLDPAKRIANYTVENNLIYNYEGASLGKNNLTQLPQLVTGRRYFYNYERLQAKLNGLSSMESRTKAA